MEQQKNLYVLFSATPYRMGKCIRFISEGNFIRNS